MQFGDFYLNMLRMIPLFKPLDDKGLTTIGGHIQEHTADDGEVIIREGDESDRMYILIEGEVQVIKDYLTQTETVVDTLRPIRWFGEMSIVDDQPRSATVVALGRCRLLALSRGDFRAILFDNAALTVSLLEDAYRRLRGINEKMSELS